MRDTSHLVALQQNLSHERERLSNAKSQKEIALRKVWVSQLEREVEQEMAFCGIVPTVNNDLSDDDLLAALSC